MAKRVKGHRANKPNDSFGTVNDEKLYRGKHREDVDNDDDDEEQLKLMRTPTKSRPLR